MPQRPPRHSFRKAVPPTLARPPPPVERRGTAAERGYDAKWRRAREAFLAANPLCVECMRENKIEPATVVDHKIPHKGDRTLFWDPANWQSICKPHHDRKTATEDGGFGRPVANAAPRTDART